MNVSILSMTLGIFAGTAYYVSLLAISDADKMSVISLLLLILGFIAGLAALYFAYRTFRRIPPKAPSLWWMARGVVGGLTGMIVVLAIIINSLS